jgi:NAD(P)H-dependent FMN reductase
MTTVKIILASTRPGSSGPAIGAWVADRARNAGTFDRVEVLDLAQVNLPFLDEPEHPRLGRYTHPHTLAWSQDIDTADALIILTPEYNGGFPAPLKNALDFLHAEWRNKALGFVTYSGGPRGGAGAAAMLAPVTAMLGLVTTNAAVAIPRASAQLIDGTFMPTGGNEASLASMLDELASTDGRLAPLRGELAMAG